VGVAREEWDRKRSKERTNPLLETPAKPRAGEKKTPFHIDKKLSHLGERSRANDCDSCVK